MPGAKFGDGTGATGARRFFRCSGRCIARGGDDLGVDIFDSGPKTPDFGAGGAGMMCWADASLRRRPRPNATRESCRTNGTNQRIRTEGPLECLLYGPLVSL